MNVTATNISFGGTFTASISNLGGTILGSANISLNLTGDLTTQGGLLMISNDQGGTIGSDTVINVTAANISTGGSLNAFNARIVNSSGGSGGNILGSANINYNLTGDLTTAGGATLVILNDHAGMIGANAAINVSAASISSGVVFGAGIANNFGGNIVGSANINFNLTGGLTTAGNGTVFLPRSTTTAVARSAEAPISRLISAANWPRRSATRASRSITPMRE